MLLLSSLSLVSLSLLSLLLLVVVVVVSVVVVVLSVVVVVVVVVVVGHPADVAQHVADERRRAEGDQLRDDGVPEAVEAGEAQGGLDR